MHTVLSYDNTTPTLADDVLVARGAQIIGDVEIGEGSSIWYNSVIRGDVNIIRIGENTNIQDGTVIHVATFGSGTHIGDRVTVGHMALLHDCRIEDEGFVGMGSIVMDGAVIESRAMLAAGSLLSPGKIVPTGQLWAGRPARYMRDLNDKDNEIISWSWEHYRKLAVKHASEQKRD